MPARKFHLKTGFTTLLGCSSPYIFRFMEALKKEQAITDFRITQLMLRKMYKREPNGSSFMNSWNISPHATKNTTSTMSRITFVRLLLWSSTELLRKNASCNFELFPFYFTSLNYSQNEVMKLHHKMHQPIILLMKI